MKTKLTCVLALAVAAVGWSASANALVVDTNLYCSAGTDATTNSETSSYTLNTSDVDLTASGTVYTAEDCYGPDSNIRNGKNQQLADIQDVIAGGGWGSGFEYADRTDEGSTVVDGYEFTLSGNLGSNDSTFSVAWQDVDLNTAPNAPALFSFVLLLKASNTAAAYLLSDIDLVTSAGVASGNFLISFLNPGGNFPGLSHATLLARYEGEGGGGIVETPEPATLMLFGGSLLGLVAFGRRRRERQV